MIIINGVIIEAWQFILIIIMGSFIGIICYQIFDGIIDCIKKR